jgi:hypothetical protein
VAVTAAGWILGALCNLFFIVLAIQKGFIAMVRRIWPRRSWRTNYSRPMAVAAMAATD